MLDRRDGQPRDDDELDDGGRDGAGERAEDPAEHAAAVGRDEQQLGTGQDLERLARGRGRQEEASAPRATSVGGLPVAAIAVRTRRWSSWTATGSAARRAARVSAGSPVSRIRCCTPALGSLSTSLRSGLRWSGSQDSQHTTG